MLSSSRFAETSPASSRQPAPLTEVLREIKKSYWLRFRNGQPEFEEAGTNGRFDASAVDGMVTACPLDRLGDATFRQRHGLRYAYVAGAMANGIGSVEIVEAMGRAGMLGFFGAAGLSPDAVDAAIHSLQSRLGREDSQPMGFNLIHSPNEPELENAIVDLYLRRHVRLVEASAFLDLTLPIVRYRVHGISREPSGRMVVPNRIIAKVSRVEVATKFMSPPPQALLQELVRRGEISPQQAEWAGQIPMADDVTAEADSAGHTDNRPAIALLPTIIALRDRLQERFCYPEPVGVGLAGGISTPASAAAAFAMGAAYVVTGSVNQACVESGSSDLVRQMLAEAEQADCIMAPAADMFEMGVKLQVLKRGTMFAMRAQKLYELYRKYDALEEIPAAERASLEKTVFRLPLDEVWHQTCDFFRQRDPKQIERARRDAKHKMALVFRWYLGQSSRWANSGESSRRIDFQIWCGPAMGAFNEWVKGSFLEQPANRQVVTVALNILYGASVLLRANQLRCQGVPVAGNFLKIVPQSKADLEQYL
ncbi:MAG: 2-nitropropane dioxygenase [Gemmatales bacterium]|nr:MAG: 2-nitropropane dioxygenase [Gemmatales bacterium]